MKSVTFWLWLELQRTHTLNHGSRLYKINGPQLFTLIYHTSLLLWKYNAIYGHFYIFYNLFKQHLRSRETFSLRSHTPIAGFFNWIVKCVKGFWLTLVGSLWFCSDCLAAELNENIFWGCKSKLKSHKQQTFF